MTRQAELLELSRSAVYYRPQPTSDADLVLMRRIDELHLDHPFAGARMLRDLLRRRAIAVGRKHVATLMRIMGIEALYRKANTSRRHPEHRIYPYLLRGLTIDRPNQVWAMDITYLPMARGFVYLAVVLDWATPPHLGVAAVEQSDRRLLHRGAGRSDRPLRRTGNLEHRPGQSIHRQRVHRHTRAPRTSRSAWTAKAAGATTCSSSGCGRRSSTRRSISHAYDTVSAARESLTRYISFYNGRRPHTALDRQTPDAAYFERLPLAAAA